MSKKKQCPESCIALLRCSLPLDDGLHAMTQSIVQEWDLRKAIRGVIHHAWNDEDTKRILALLDEIEKKGIDTGHEVWLG